MNTVTQLVNHDNAMLAEKPVYAEDNGDILYSAPVKVAVAPVITEAEAMAADLINLRTYGMPFRLTRSQEEAINAEWIGLDFSTHPEAY